MNTKLFLPAAALISLGLGAIALAQNSNPSAAAMEARTPDRTIYLRQLPTPAELTREAAAQRLAIVRIEQSDRSVVIYYQTADGSITKDAYELMAAASVPVAPSVPSAPVVPAVPSVPALSMPMAPAASPAPAAGAVTVVLPSSPAPAVTYYDYPAPAVYYYAYPASYYYPAYYGYPNSYWGGYPRVGVNLNFGFRGGVGFRGGAIGFRGPIFRGGYRFHR